MTRIAIIGSGVAGLSCARRLADAGLRAVVLDKGRGIGGRVATRRADPDMQFDHGAQHIKATNPAFEAVLEQAKESGALARWSLCDGTTRYVGTPGMTGFAKFLGQGIDIRQKTEVTALSSGDRGWDVQIGDTFETYDIVASTIPSPQAEALVGTHLPAAFDTVRYDPCLTLMVGLMTPPDLPVTATNPTDAFGWIARDSGKPGRPEAECWVAQANPDWSVAHLEYSKNDICALMLAPFLEHAGLSAPDVAYASAHRWRYAQVATPLGASFVSNKGGTLYAGGDWCLGSKVEHAWQSGTAMADDMLTRLS